MNDNGQSRELDLITQAGGFLGQALEIALKHKGDIAKLPLKEALNGAKKWDAYRLCLKKAEHSLISQNQAAELCIRHKRQAGAILGDNPELSKPDPTKANLYHDDTSYGDIGITRLDAQRMRDIARVPEEEFEDLIERIEEDGDRELTAAELAKIGRRMRQEEAKPEWSANEKFPGSACVVQGDAIAFLNDFDPGEIDLLLTDPPYSTEIEDIDGFARSWLALALSRIKPTGRAYIFIGAYPREQYAYMDAFYKHCKSPAHHMSLEMILPWVYRNTIGPPTKESYKLNWQACLYFMGPDVAALNTESLNDKFAVQDCNAPDGRHGIRLHAWEKPQSLAERFIKHTTMPGDLVVDPFAGTGTFLAAAARLGRTAEGCEQSKTMINFCKQRGIEYAK